MSALIIIGPPRCGTTACFRWLAEHPEISPAERKELNYFTGQSVTHDHFDAQSQPPYTAHFQHKEGAKITLEASPVYSHPQLSKVLYHRIIKTLPDAKIMVMLRDPVRRFVSHYNVDKREGKGHALSMADYVHSSAAYDADAIPPEAKDTPLAQNIWLQVADYPAILSRALAHFPAERIIPVFMDWFADDPEYCAQYLTDALGLDQPLDASAIRAENTYYKPRNLGVHQFASRVRLWSEPVLQRFPAIRQRLYAAYRAVNIGNTSGPKPDPATSEAHRELRRFYAPRNQALSVVLTETFGITRQPDWVKEAPSEGSEGSENP